MKDFKISDVGDLIRGVSYKKEQMSLTSKKGYIKLLRANNINGKLNEDELQYVPETIVRGEQIIKAGDVLIAMSSGSKHLVGKSAVSETDDKRTFGAFCGLLRANKFDPFLLSKVLQTNDFRQYISEESSGSNINNLRREHILEFSFKAPDSLDAQKKLNQKLEGFLDKIEAGHDELLKAQASIALLKQSILNSAIRGKLVPQDPTDEPASKLLEKIQKEKERLIAEKKIKKEKPLLAISEDEITFELPTGWVWSRLGNLINLYSGQHIEANDYNMDKKGIPYLTGPSDFGQKHPVITKWTTKPKVIAPGNSILVTVKGSGVGKINYLYQEGVCISRQLMAVECLLASSEYIEIFLHKSFDKLTGGAQGLIPGLSREDIESLICPVPPLEEQIRIARMVKGCLAQVEKIATLIAVSLKESGQLKQSILKKAFEGEL